MSLRPQIAALVRAGLDGYRAGFPLADDPNLAFDPPANTEWAGITFLDGAEVPRSINGANALLVTPVLAYIDIWTPLDAGDGLASQLARIVKNSLRRQVLDGGRWHRFEEGPEGRENGRYRKQVVAVFWQFDRG